MDLAGDVVRSGEGTGIRYHEVMYGAGSSLAKHSHTAAFFALSMARAYIEGPAGGRRVESLPRSVIFHPPGEEHAITVGDAIARCFVLEIEGKAVMSRLPRQLLHARGGPLSTLLAAIYEEIRWGDDSSPLAVEGLLLQLIAQTS